MSAWWNGLSGLSRAFFGSAIFFSTIFIWQFVASLSGLGGDEAEASEGGPEVGEDGVEIDIGEADSGDTDLIEDASGLATLRLLSIRSILAFGMLFSWAGALYLSQGQTAAGAILRAALWGLAGMVAVALFFWMLPRLAEEGTADLDTAIGQAGEVYMNIPGGGAGQVRVMVSGAVSFVNARSADGRPLPAGTPVKIVRRLDARTIEVVPIES